MAAAPPGTGTVVLDRETCASTGGATTTSAISRVPALPTAAQPVVDQAARDRELGRQADLLREDLVAVEPGRLLELGGVDPHFAPARGRPEAEHDRRRERPGL